MDSGWLQADTSLGTRSWESGFDRPGVYLSAQQVASRYHFRMLHRHLNHERLTPAAVDDIIRRGKLADWVELARALRSDRREQLARTVRTICDRGRADPEAPFQSFAFWTCYLDAHRNDRAA